MITGGWTVWRLRSARRLVDGKEKEAEDILHKARTVAGPAAVAMGHNKGLRVARAGARADDREGAREDVIMSVHVCEGR